MALLEIACFNPDSAVAASEAGADRIELCDNADVGGTTPPLSWLTTLRDKIKIPINVMVRPRGGDFVYSVEEFQEMKDVILRFKPIADGFVFGILKHDRSVDAVSTSELVKLAAPLPCTFHRAFDETTDLFQALEDIDGCGIRTILTSGGASSAVQNCDVLAQLVKQAGGRVVVMPGGGVRSTNIAELKARTNALVYHSSALIAGQNIADIAEIGQMKAILHPKP
ncbi:uncharacterized protein Z520_11772 [Fonsecaea multimorphosa CBS 102226]|uniref:Copper homeostasis protein cutC homolog n=1 Tax=Fonsecaea multimorphosa CBS 102226 TaxID=1442371 RepID=A0A0D2JGZ6_9EURO|nr:uncharacterized protein Z520_11772 [Fonsecaea multimorphosa CBS 102226]KIX92452.1 hypothetical protein Z520_11772 [Fonsecaea multimorphosa CBS 102226]OAL19569.1 hypothetical protein AYO22_09731 [Fonsecaea multimorphosa]